VNPAPADIVAREDISRLVAEFYWRVFTGELLGPVFLDVARVDLAVHLPVMCDFWQTVLLHAGPSAQRAAVSCDLSARIELSPAYFARWLSLWTAVVDERHTGETAGARERSGRPARRRDQPAAVRPVARELSTTRITPPDL
jgi:hemoglobin